MEATIDTNSPKAPKVNIFFRVIEKCKVFFALALSPVIYVSRGDFLQRAKGKANLSYVFFCVMLGILYIANSFWVDGIIRQTNDLEVELKELHYEYLSSKSVWISKSKASVIEKYLSDRGVVQTTQPPYKLRLNETDHLGSKD